MLFRTFTVENWLIFGKTFEFYMREFYSFQMLSIHWMCRLRWKCAAHVVFFFVFSVCIRTIGMHTSQMVRYSTLLKYRERDCVSRVRLKCSISASWRRWIKCDMRATSTRTKTNKTKQKKARKHHHQVVLFWNCIKKQCNSLQIAIDIYLCFISLWNIEIV